MTPEQRAQAHLEAETIKRQSALADFIMIARTYALAIDHLLNYQQSFIDAGRTPPDNTKTLADIEENINLLAVKLLGKRIT